MVPSGHAEPDFAVGQTVPCPALRFPGQKDRDNFRL